MPLETATYVPDLNTSNPGHTDGLSQTDSHLRLIKSALKTTFPNFTSAALASTQAAIDAAVSTVTGLAAHLFPLGSAAAPSITPIGDTDTGIYSAGANKLDIATAGVKAVEIDASQNVALAASLTVGGTITATGAIAGAVPIGGTLIWWDNTLPAEGGWAWANGQVIASANTVCPVLLARWGATFGGNGTSTMGVPNLCEVTPVGKSTMGGAAARGLLATVRNTIAAIFGEEKHALTSAENGPHTHDASVTDPGHAHLYGGAQPIGLTHGGSVDGEITQGTTYSTTTNATGITVSNSSSGSGTAHNNMQPSTTCNWIIRLG